MVIVGYTVDLLRRVAPEEKSPTRIEVIDEFVLREVLDGYTEKAQVFSVFCRGTYDGECELSRGFGAKQTDFANSGEKNSRHIQTDQAKRDQSQYGIFV